MSKNAIEKVKIGILYFLLGSACTYAAIFRPLQMAGDSAPSVTTSRFMMAVAPIMTIYGATYIFFPKFVEKHIGGYPGQKPTPPLTPVGLLFIIVNLIIGVGLAAWTYFRLRALGYSFRF